ncbi:MAG: DUF58 domain-containing protein [Pseudobdellovibrionaceae bacterium]|nr:DUF58 domain-containing protein [Bdellovibrionales bacterium]USN47525.1 MAG: DUF58 domain-containing protein [Pseudobdellovibrionaceae bacterium]
MSLPPEILKKVKLLELATRKLVNNRFAGDYHSAFKGQGMTFAEFREYVPGDDIRAISWPLTARTGKPYIKIFDEERENCLMLAVDVSGSSDFGTGEYFKGDVMAHIAALLSFSAVRNNDPTGLVLFSDQVEHYVPPKKGRGHVLRILRDLYYFKPKSRGTRVASALEFLQGVLKKRSHVFIISDFLDQGFDQALRMMGKRHDTVAVVVQDQAEVEIPNLGLIDLQDPETGEVVTVDTGSRAFRRDYSEYKRKERAATEEELKRAQVDRIDIKSNEDFVDPLIVFFKKRARR